MSDKDLKIESKIKRQKRTRFKIAGAGRLRLSVFLSNRHIYAQIIDDLKGNTLVAASTLDKGFRLKESDPFNKETAREVGRRIAKKAIDKDIKQVVFDRGPYLYHGKIRALADGAREGGLDF
jgi:large subunit ribosomal protein L18